MATQSTGKRQDSVRDGKLRIEYGNNRIIIQDETHNRFVVGSNASGDIIAKLSKAGFDVLNTSESNMIWSSESPSFMIAEADTVSVTRTGGTDSGSEDVVTSVLDAEAFIAFWYVPGASPEFKQQTPAVLFNTSGADSGKIIGARRALYDPSVGVVRFFVDATTIHPTYNSNETIEFSYFLLHQSIPTSS